MSYVLYSLLSLSIVVVNLFYLIHFHIVNMHTNIPKITIGMLVSVMYFFHVKHTGDTIYIYQFSNLTILILFFFSNCRLIVGIVILIISVIAVIVVIVYKFFCKYINQIYCYICLIQRYFTNFRYTPFNKLNLRS